MDNTKFDLIRNNVIAQHEQSLVKMQDYNQKLAEAVAANDERLIEMCENRIASLLITLSYQQSRIEFMRPNTEIDRAERTRIFNEYPQLIRDAVPDNVPFVFHGNRNIGTIHQIIESGGLLTPEQMGVGFRSFASQIDVTCKQNIKVSCEFADTSLNDFMPYGAIFVFTPLEEEVATVLGAGDSTEVNGGVDGVDFVENSERLVGIITTEETKPIIQAWCLEYGWDAEKVFTHDEFLLKCKELFVNPEIAENISVVR